ncbi:hypothetical protein EDB92DRAFT_700863 [Lactarius akahatsu]|uniref:DUF6535 domain-containing protein n=1 Tax=Lactarius akahatsu TaxID=416441 RepID=A0AAD4LHE2_9AGAM|nr:hypothetical protein EDB92DRAFT_700863 [Lactarius akahatsu]
MPRGMSNFVDGSGLSFSMYSEMTMEEGKKMVHGWKADADGIPIFTSLFSAAVTSLISVSIQDIRPNPQDTSNLYLANIDPTRRPCIQQCHSHFSPCFPAPIFTANLCSLGERALVLELGHQYQLCSARDVTRPRYTPHKRARIRAFFAEDVDKFLLPWAVEALPTLLHVSSFLLWPPSLCSFGT